MLGGVARHARRGIGREADIGIEEQKMRPPRGLRELRAGMHLAGPAGRQGRGGFEPHAAVARGEPARDLRGAVGGAVIHHDHLDRDAARGERGLDTAGDLRFLVARGDQDGDERAVRGRAARGAREDQVRRDHRRGEGGEEQGDPGPGEVHLRHPVSARGSWRGS
jgi:hypothetical protein